MFPFTWIKPFCTLALLNGVFVMDEAPGYIRPGKSMRTFFLETSRRASLWNSTFFLNNESDIPSYSLIQSTLKGRGFFRACTLGTGWQESWGQSYNYFCFSSSCGPQQLMSFPHKIECFVWVSPKVQNFT